MMLKRWLIFGLLSLSNVVYAGNGTSGGGGAFVCRDSQKNILNSELLDLWEAQYLDHLTIMRSNDNIELQAEMAIAKLDALHNPYTDRFRAELKLILSQATPLPKEIGLPAPSDTRGNYEKKGCPLEGMMFYDGNLDHVVYNSETYDHLLSNTDKAAVWVHEAIYKVLRDDFNETDSVHTRKLVGCLFSNKCSFDNGRLKTINELLQSDTAPLKYRCEDESSIIYVTGYPTPWNGSFRGMTDLKAKNVYFEKLDGVKLKYPAILPGYEDRPENGGWRENLYFQDGLEKYGLLFADGKSFKDESIYTFSYYFDMDAVKMISVSYFYHYANPKLSNERETTNCKQIN